MVRYGPAMAPRLSPFDRVQAAGVAPMLALPARAQVALSGGAPVMIDGQTLDPGVQLLLKVDELQGKPALETLPVAQAREQIAREAALFTGRPIAMARVEDITVAGADGPLKARRYVPHGFTAPGPGLVYFHGGGWTVLDLDSHDQTCRFLARRAGVTVISVDYRLAPEHVFPAAVEDAAAAFADIHASAAEHGLDPARIAVGGDSAGGHLSTVASLIQRDAGGPLPAFQLLIYPVVDGTAEARSYELFADGFLLTRGTMRWYWDNFAPAGVDRSDPRCSPLLAKDLKGLPPAYLITAGFDPLRDEGEAYAARLRDAGVPVTLRRHAGLIHGFANMVGVGRVAAEALAEAAGALQVGLANPAPAPESRRRRAAAKTAD